MSHMQGQERPVRAVHVAVDEETAWRNQIACCLTIAGSAVETFARLNTWNVFCCYSSGRELMKLATSSILAFSCFQESQ